MLQPASTSPALPSLNMRQKTASLFHVSIDYLLDDETIHLNTAATDYRKPEEQKLIIRYNKLSKRSKEDLLEYISLLELRDKA